MLDVGHGTGPESGGENEILPALYEGARKVAVAFDAHSLTLAECAQAYVISKRRRLTPASERGYVSCLRELIAYFPQHRVVDFEPPAGATLIEDFLADRWGHLSPRTYNKAFSIVHNFFEWFVARGVLTRDPMATLERAKPRAIHRVTFTETQVSQILAANTQPRDQIALRRVLA